MNTLPTQQDLRRLLADTGVTLPDSKSLWAQESVVWTVLGLIHCTLLLGMWDLIIHLWPINH